MSNNTTRFLLQPSFNTSNIEAEYHSFALYVVNLSVLIPIAVLSPVAVVANALVLAAIWRNPSLRTPSYILLAGLAITDFCTGLISQPFFVTNELIYLANPQLIDLHDVDSWPTFYLITKVIGDGCGVYFFQLTILIITLMSIERWLHMTRRSFLTVRRICFIVIVSSLLLIPSAVFHYTPESYITTSSLALFCFIVTSVAYFKVFRIIRRHQQQIQTSTLSQNVAQPSINFVKYKKSVFSILYILAVFYISYLPILIIMGLFLFWGNYRLEALFFNISLLLLFLSSSLNPLILLWRMKDIRNEVRQLLKRIFCKNS